KKKKICITTRKKKVQNQQKTLTKNTVNKPKLKSVKRLTTWQTVRLAIRSVNRAINQTDTNKTDRTSQRYL
ncbi:hypothetical protein CSC81_18360, partial [Tenacibaculum discolor]